jgi:hypothetical protein
MQFQQTPMQMRTMNRSSPESTMSITAEPSTKEIPYDYVARFVLTGRCGERVQDVINISVEGAFVAVAIGYSFIPAPLLCSRSRQTNGTPVPDVSAQQDNNLLAQLLAIVQPVANPQMLVACVIERLCGIHFKYSILDSGSGRELQNQPIHNIAGLGESSGDRPFRPLAKPMVFMPRSTIRIEIEEISEGPLYGYEDPQTKQRFGAELYMVLHGYKILGYGTGLP